jgi:hypothetical protein
MGSNTYAISYTLSTRTLRAYKTNGGTTGTVNYRKHLLVSDYDLNPQYTEGGGYSVDVCYNCTNSIIAENHKGPDKVHDISVTVPQKTVNTYGWQ